MCYQTCGSRHTDYLLKEAHFGQTTYPLYYVVGRAALCRRRRPQNLGISLDELVQDFLAHSMLSLLVQHNLQLYLYLQFPLVATEDQGIDELLYCVD